MSALVQIPSPGRRLALHCGDLVEFRLSPPPGVKGAAWLRSNLGRDDLRRREIIAAPGAPRPARDWWDVPMCRTDGGDWQIKLPLLQPGHFQAKCFFLPEGGDTPLWPDGGNVGLNVHPAAHVCATLVYNAFVRQFGRATDLPPLAGFDLARLDHAGYAVIPPSGTFRDLARELDFIIGRLGCRVLLLLPIHPTPTVYGRMGRYGSPYAALDFFDVDPALAEFDRHRTPMEQFQELVDAVHARRAKIWLDIAINHTGWAAKLHTLHPEWLFREPDGGIRSPGAWGVVWEDLTELDHQAPGLRDYLADVFLFWCRHGADGFRCDAAYMIPVAVWEYVVARVRDEFPETFFLLEGLGGSLEATISLMHDANLNGAYSEIFQNYERAALEHYLPLAQRVAAENGMMMHFAETHDNERLAARSPAYARMRTALAALTSINGAFAFANGVEWLAREKIDVHGRADLGWGGADNIVDWIRRLQALLRTHPAFFPGAEMRQIQVGPGNALAVLRRPPEGAGPLLALINLDDTRPVDLSWPAADFASSGGRAHDLLSGRNVELLPAGRDRLHLRLAPAETLCLTGDAAALKLLNGDEEQAGLPPARVDRQLLRHKVMQICNYFRGFMGLQEEQLEGWTDLLCEDPAACCRRLAPEGADCISRWQAPRDSRRLVMLPVGHWLLSIMPHPFRLRLDAAGRVLAQEDSLPMADGNHFVLLPPQAARREMFCDLRAILYAPGGVDKLRGRLLCLPSGTRARLPRVAFAPERRERLISLGVNGRGGMSRAAVAWGELYSRYDALLAANLHPRHPGNRRMLFTRCRAWLVYRGYSRELNRVCLTGFHATEQEGVWSFLVPFGAEGHVRLQLRLGMTPDVNAVHLLFKRLPAGRDARALPDAAAARLVLRPDIEDRDFHEDTLAYTGPENSWPAAVSAMQDGFVFAPAPERRLCLRLSRGGYQAAPEWQYMVHHPVEAERGLRDHSDLFSPGFFTADLAADEEVRLTADTDQGLTPPPPAGRRRRLLSDALEQSLRCYVVRRDELRTVIAGYPWFLDWGRDTLICARGMIAAGMLDEVRQIILQFAAFEDHGTLPNMINGAETANRETSDAPLWLVTACADWCRAAGDRELLNAAVGQRSLREVLDGILTGYRHGTSNGIRMDRETALIYSPAHFTWMDTNHPAGTPRAGYPVEIQGLWWAALDFLGADDGRSAWRRLAARVRENIRALYWDPARGFLSDCRHAAPGQSAREAQADDALRPNQLLVLTLGALADADIGQAVLQACGELLVPGGLRSLADRPVTHPLPVRRDGRLLNDPVQPYWPRYEGDEDTRRKPAYHNGTAWSWLFPSYCEAWFKVHGPAGRPAALSWLAGGVRATIARGCIGHLPEIMDGDYPHQPRGCDAQAWGCAESYRVLRLLDQDGSAPAGSR